MSKEKIRFKSIDSIPASAWQSFEEKKIFFGHQSVGKNIIRGIKSILKENPGLHLNIIETNTPDSFTAPVFGHFRVGENFDPLSKNKDFSAMMDSGIGRKTDIAFYKYCYIDISGKTDVKSLFSSYKLNMEILRKAYPQVTFIHVTVPLTVVQTGPRAWVKKVIGRKIGGYESNIKRNEFNALMRKEYDGKELIFDLAQIESTFPDGRRMTFRKNGQIYSSLVPDYSSDGRHLNEQGGKLVAEQLLILLAESGNLKGNNR
jgi:hypothetical protein